MQRLYGMPCICTKITALLFLNKTAQKRGGFWAGGRFWEWGFIFSF